MILDQFDELVSHVPLLVAHVPRLVRVLGRGRVRPGYSATLARGPGHQPVREIRYPRDLGPELGPMGLQPEQLGHLHLERDAAPHKVQHWVTCRVNLLCLRLEKQINKYKYFKISLLRNIYY